MSLQYEIKGNKESEFLLIFLQGWPDKYQIWDYLNIKQLSNYELLFINMPNYGKNKIPWGMDFPQLCQKIKQIIMENGDNKKKIAVAHDWGCIYSYMIDHKNKGFFDHIIAMDVPGIFQFNSILQSFYVISYQYYLIMSFLIGGKIGDFMTKLFAKFIDHTPSYYNQINSGMNYPYYFMWKNIILSKFYLTNPYLKGYKPTIPITYMYGKNKKFQFHGKKWLQYLANQDNCNVIEMEGNHWIMKKNSNKIVQLINKIIKKENLK